VHCGQRVAWVGMLEKQYAHALTSGGSSSGWRFMRFIALMMRKTTKAIMRNSIATWMNCP
jgi:hypothetical protein